VQADDWLSTLADKYYGDPLAFPAIFEATNAKALTDDTYPTIQNPNLIEVGWNLCIPSAGDAQAMLNIEPLQVTVSILPQKYFVERIGGQYVVPTVMVLPGNSPATYEPQPEQLTALSEAKAYFRIGVPFENAWMDRFASVNDKMLIVDTRDGTNPRSWPGTPDKIDPHIWLSPIEVKIQAQTIKDTLAQLDPDHAATYQANLDSFIADIDALDADIRRTLAGVTDRKFMVFHPAWGYFARDYELEMIPIEIGGQEPSAAELADLIKRAQEENIKFVFAQPEFSTKEAETIAQEIGGEVLLISPLNPDWLNNLNYVADTFAEVLGQ
jgi:zinc transport system substrate-binding protein